jgi:3'(2'), 5'-bisphosphate nucleotidase
MADLDDCQLLTELLPRVTALACESGRAILTIYQDLNPAVEYKLDRSPVTQADIVSHHILWAGLAGLPPHWPVLSEESVEVPFDERKSWRHFWMIDPLDGTKEFLHRTGEFTVNIALIEDDRPILGVVYAPVFDKLYFAARGAGSYRTDGKITTPIKVGPAMTGGTRFVVSRCHAAEQETLAHFIDQTKGRETIVMGSSLKFCLIAEGAADVYPRNGPTMEWDTAAAQCILEEAGGSVTDLEGNTIRYNKNVLLNSAFVARAHSNEGRGFSRA